MNGVIERLNTTDLWAILAATTSMVMVVVTMLIAVRTRRIAEDEQRSIFYFSQSMTNNLVTRLKITIAEGKAKNRAPAEIIAQLEGMLSFFDEVGDAKIEQNRVTKRNALSAAQSPPLPSRE